MLAVQGHNGLGNVLHIITGPETELFTDIHGAAIMDITPLLVAMDQEKRVFISLTRCRQEQVTETIIKASGLTCLTSFGDLGKTMAGMSTERKPQEGYDDIAAGPGVTSDGAPPPPPTPRIPLQICHYCQKEAELLPIPGIHICTTCAQIEIGLHKQEDTPDADAEDHTG